jgi:hypothetical protein
MSSTCQNKTNSKFDQDTNLLFNTNKCIDNYGQLYEIQAGKTKYEYSAV